MGYIDKESLLELLENTENEERRYILNYLLASYIFDAQWQTVEEFRANPVEVFYWNDMHNNTDNWNDVNITHVMPIKTPDAPK